MAMRFSKQILIVGALGVMVGLPCAGWAQCTSSQDAAVACFVKNAVSTHLAVVPPGMSQWAYKAYGVAVSKFVQDSKTVAVVFGMTSAIGDALPPTNVNGTPNQAAQDAAVNAIMDAALKDGIITLPSGTTADQLKQMARDMTGALAQNSGISVSPGLVLRTLDTYLVAATSSTGDVNLLQVTSGVSNLVSNLLASGLMKLPTNITAGNITQFALDVTMAIDQYKRATGKARL
jgi:hypothetical protein